MAGMDGCPCGCWQSQEARALAEKQAAEHQADLARYAAEFETFCDARPDKAYPPLPVDYERRNRGRFLDEAIARADGWPTAVVRRVT